MSASLSVLHLVANRWWTGSADSVIRLVAALRDHGHRVFLGAMPGDRLEAKAHEAGLSLVEGLQLDTGVAPIGAVRDLRHLRRLVRDERVQIIHAHHSHDHWLAWLVGRGRVPVVRTFHNRRAVKSHVAARSLYRRTRAVFAVSRAIEARCREVGVPAAQVFWTPGSADLARFAADVDPGAIRAELGLGRAPVVVSVARLARNRGHERLLAGFRLLLGRMPEARLLLVGKGEMREPLERRVAELGLGERVVFAGYRDRDLPSVLAAADCFALMAAGSDESCRAALEAMAAARPVVAGHSGALPETVLHGETGLLVPDDGPDSVAEALATVLGDRARADAMGAAGRRRAETVFAPDRSVAIVERVYRTLA